MPTNFVDFAGMNTLISSSFDDTNTLSSGRNTEVFSSGVPTHQELVGINIHRNGPYGFSTWKQLRASENPISRHHRETNKLTFIARKREFVSNVAIFSSTCLETEARCRSTNTSAKAVARNLRRCNGSAMPHWSNAFAKRRRRCSARSPRARFI